MLSLNQLQLFKTEKCEEPLCLFQNEECITQCTLEELTDCEYFHAAIDQRRPPFLNIKDYHLKYESNRDIESPERGCLNKLEYFYHPEFYKTEECTTKNCKWYYCPYFHQSQEKEFWDQIRTTMKKSSAQNLFDNKKQMSQLDMPMNCQPKEEIVEKELNTNNISIRIEDLINMESSLLEKRSVVEESNTFVNSLSKNQISENPINSIESKNTSDKFIKSSKLLQDSKAVLLDDTQISKIDDGDEDGNLLCGDEETVSLQNQFAIISLNQGNKNPLPGAHIYFLWEPVDMVEDENHEFKIFQNDKDLEDLINKYVCGFLNSRGGTVYLGIRDDGVVVGVPHSRKDLDRIKIAIDYLGKKFYPPVLSSQYRVIERLIYDKKKSAIDYNRRIIEIYIMQGDPEELYFNGVNKAFIRRQASCTLLTPTEMKIEVRKRARHYLARNLISLIDDPSFDEEIGKMELDQLIQFQDKLKTKYKLVKQIQNQKKDEPKSNLFFEKLIIGKKNN